MRGQAFIVFETPQTSTAAKRGLSGFSFYGKELVIDYATGGKSKALLRRELGEEAVQEMDLERSLTTVSRRGEKRNVHAEDEEEDDGEEGGEAERKRVKLETATNDEEEAEAEPGAVLKVLNLPQTIDLEVITALFSRQDGFLSARTTKTEQGEEAGWQANITFTTPSAAKEAKAAMQGMQLDPTYKLVLDIL